MVFPLSPRSDTPWPISYHPSYPSPLPLQETEELEEEKSGLQKEIAELQKEKEKRAKDRTLGL